MLKRSRKRLWRTIFVGLLALAFAGCASPKVEVESRPGVDYARLGPASIEIVPAGISNELETAPWLTAELVRVAQDALRAKGYALVRSRDARLRVFVIPKLDVVFQRAFSGDPDHGGTRLVPREAAVVIVRVVDLVAGQDVWRASVRQRLPGVALGGDRPRRWVVALEAGLRELDPAVSAP